MRYMVSDLHFGHVLAWKLYRNRFATLADMHEDIIQTWNKTVKSKDIVYVIGDVSFLKFEETKAIIQRLKGIKRLIVGNHDSRFNTREWIDIGFDDVRDEFVFKKNNQKWLLGHYPYSSSIKFFIYKLRDKIFHKKNEANYYKLFPKYCGYKLVHGHRHTGPVYTFDQIDVAWDISHKLWNENELLEIFEKNEPSKLKRIWNSIKLVFW